MQSIHLKTALLSSSLALLLMQSVASNAEEHMHDHGDNPLLTYVLIDRLERQDGKENDSNISLDAQAWIGKDLNKFWLKTEITRSDGITQDAEIQALYSHAFTPFWDVQIGLRRDEKPVPTRDWAVIGVQGLAPYWFEIEAAVFIGKSNALAARLNAEYELLITQRLILTPDLELNLYGQNDLATNTGAGLSDISAGLRLRYEIQREFAPYIGVHWQHSYGKTADYLALRGATSTDIQWVIGLRAWY